MVCLKGKVNYLHDIAIATYGLYFGCILFNLEREDGQTCEREEDENVQSINARRLLRGAASRRNIRNFRSVCLAIYLALPL